MYASLEALGKEVSSAEARLYDSPYAEGPNRGHKPLTCNDRKLERVVRSIWKRLDLSAVLRRPFGTREADCMLMCV
jgi:hypothetical protein